MRLVKSPWGYEELNPLLSVPVSLFSEFSYPLNKVKGF